MADTHVADEPVWSTLPPQFQEILSTLDRDSGVVIPGKESLGSEWTR
jgi:hypothetical protein